MIEIWGRTGCGYCVAAKKLCEDRNYKYVYHQLGEQFTREEMLEMFPDAKTYPQIKVSGTPVGGYEDLTKYIEETNYSGTGHSL